MSEIGTELLSRAPRIYQDGRCGPRSWSPAASFRGPTWLSTGAPGWGLQPRLACPIVGHETDKGRESRKERQESGERQKWEREHGGGTERGRWERIAGRGRGRWRRRSGQMDRPRQVTDIDKETERQKESSR